MNTNRLLITACAVFVAGAMARAQEAIPAPAPRPVPAVAPMAPAQVTIPAPEPRPVPVVAPMLPELPELPGDFDLEKIKEMQERVQAKMEAHRADLELFAADMAAGMRGKIGVAAPVLAAQQVFKGRFESDDRLYERGQRALESCRWDEALESFTQVAGRAAARADGALYWKAYTLNKLGRRDEALAALAELRKSYASSRWLDDAKALEIEVKQASGQTVKPESETDEDLKLMALNGIMQSDPDRALPLLENLLKSSQSPKLKERALFVLAASDVPRGRQLLEQVARGGAGDPDLQLKAINFIGARSKKQDNRQLLWEIYSGSNDAHVKRALLSAFMAARDKEHLLQAAKTEKSQQLRMDAISMLGASAAQPELWEIYQAETSADVKERILHSMASGGNADRILEVARTEKDPKLRRAAIHSLGSMRSAQTGDNLVSLYGSESDAGVKRAIVDSLSGQRNAKALVELARKETDPRAKREIVSRLSGMKSKEAADYLMELLK
jgi:tetratricopeptide (TPR) repeat protein